MVISCAVDDLCPRNISSFVFRRTDEITYWYTGMSPAQSKMLESEDHALETSSSVNVNCPVLYADLPKRRL